MTQSSATLNAYVNSLGGARSAIVLFNFGTNTDMTMTAGQQLAGATGPVSTAISGLIPGTSYYYQAIAQMPDGSKSYGSVETFTTLGSSKVAVSTLPASSITMSSAVLDGSLDNLAGAGAVQVWFEYGPTADFGNSTPMQARTSPGPYSATVTGLSPNSTYYFRAMGLNATGGGQAVHSMASSFVTSGSPTPAPPSPETPAFVWLIGLGFVVIIIILIVMLVSRR
jgi:phosphodiesterase/alkaline phosphatase D-like protein